MDDNCAVCAETLEWAAYGQCGHREVCSTCIARLRFICDDRRCCICKSESSIVFVTKALGDYTRMINDFSILPVDPMEGQVGPFWYHEATQAFFEDFDHYKMIAAMCKLSCVVCDKKDEQGSEGSVRRMKFRNIEQLKSHLFHHHRLFTCILCLEGRKMFICEQKLYSRTQLNRHISIGDSEVDGSESERSGFKGHPACEFCQNPFYGDNELYTHMSTEHYTCHICQRQRPEQYDYYRNYDDLEIHFRREHFLCEDEACLAKKFIVFPNEPEMKRHNAMEHGGHMSRSKRNAALQIPISFQYRRSREQDQTRRRHGLHPDYSESELSSAIQASLETANAYVPCATSSRAHADSDHRETSEINPIGGSFGMLASVDSGSSLSNAPLEESSFPPLPVAARSSLQKTKKDSKGMGRTTMASHLRRQNNVTVLNTSQVRPTDTRHLSSHIGSSSQLRPMSNSGLVSSSGLSSSSTMTKSTSKDTHSASTSKLVDGGSLDHAISTSPPVSTTDSNVLTGNNKNLAKVKDIKNSNKSLVERIRADLDCNEDRYAAFKLISSEYRHGIVDTGEYLAYVHQFGLSHHVLELARLCPDAQKQKELLEACSGSLRSNGPLENNPLNSSSQVRHKKSSKKGKEKCRDDGIGGSNGTLVDSIVNSARELQLNHKPSKSDEPTNFVSGNQTLFGMTVQTHSQSTVDGSKNTLGTKAGGNKPHKKTSKFHRVRVGESSSAAVLDLTNSDGHPNPTDKGQSDDNTRGGLEALPVRGVWKNGGGKRLVGKLAMTR
ncbi:hypothetical protein RHMOL_Rhmol11G0159900 [Rhododendron molle]|uniref:Uncharacterized protein n=1 Tax=Rhododendron molle TaxID=49168 RepID=A0ACC0LSW4_RHOML|nr:hypothetical protein RHMOL_Rhmol11G0159900 [Rhododendron molle]